MQISHSYDFDPTYGMALTQLLAVEPPVPVSDFADFWTRRYAAAVTIDPRPQIQSGVKALNGHLVHELRYTSTGGVTIGGWMLIPKYGKVSRGLVVGHGYGGRESPEMPLSLDGTVFLFPCFRGLGLSPIPNVSSNPYYHVLHDIQNKHRYLLGGCVEDLWLAVSALLALFPATAGRIAYSGISFGGGIGALAAPWDARIQRLHLEVPTFGHQALRLTLPCRGSGESVRIFQRQHLEVNVMDTLAYYDAASAIQFSQIPVMVAAALFDPVVPPPGQFALYNAIPEKLRQLFVLEAGHFNYPNQAQQQAQMNQLLAEFLMAL